MKFTQKETMLLKELKEQEQTCVEKYTKYASDANDSQLKNLFSQLAQHEQQHLNTINQIMGGTVPSMQSGGGGGQQQMQLTFTPSYDMASSTPQKQKDSFLCSDLLSTEKFVAAEYNTCIFEFRDTNVRNALNHIQKEEQQHGEQIYKYMEANGMYNTN